MIDLRVNKKQLEKTIELCKKNKIIIPTYEEMKNPKLVTSSIKNELKNIGLWDVHPKNLFRVTWKNEAVPKGGLFGDANYMEIPSELSGVKARIFALVGKWFPTGAHKVGATFGCLVPRLVTGQFDPVGQKAVWPSTGNYCRGGAYISALLKCKSIAILPEEMSRERFEWLSNVAGEVIATHGCESNVKEIFDKCWELKKTRDDIVVFNQFEELGNLLWHYNITGSAMEEVLKSELEDGQRFMGTILTSGSAGTTGSGYYLKKLYPGSRLAVSEALQCPTLLNNGFGGHRIEGIGDKHIPWVHDLKETDMVMGVDDEHTIRLLRLFNETAGRKHLVQNGVDENLVNKLDLLGISSIANLISAIKFCKYYELSEKDVVFTVFTDSLELYGSRLKELETQRGKYIEKDAIRDFELIKGVAIDNILELGHYDRKRIHNLKYYTWIEQQAKDLNELNAQWYNHEEYWGGLYKITPQIDDLIKDFNKKTGLL